MDREGNVVGKPAELVNAEQFEMIARRYGSTPSQAAREPAWVLRHMAILSEAAGE